jgi:hypothetical protein
MKEFKRLLEVAEQRTSEEKAWRVEDKRLYEEEIVRVREEGNQRVEEFGKMAEEITQQVKEEASRRTEESRAHIEEVKRIIEEGNRRVEQVARMAEWIKKQAKEEATRRAEERRVHSEEVERIKKEGSQREEEIFKRAEDATKTAQEAIAAALAGKEEAERRSTKLMEEAEKIRKAVEEVTMRVEQQKGNPHTERQRRVIQNLEEVPDSDADIEAVQDLVQIPTAGSSSTGMEEPSLMEHHLRDTNQGVKQKVTFSNFNSFFLAECSSKDSIKEIGWCTAQTDEPSAL